MNESKVRWPHGCFEGRGFEGRLETELVKVVTQRAAVPQGPLRRPSVRAGLVAGTAAAAATAAALGVPALTHQAAAPSTGFSPEPGSVHIRTAAFTVASHADGTIHVTWDKSKYFQDRTGLQQALRAAGFPVLVKEGVFCKGPHDSGHLDPSGVGPGVGRVMKGERQAGGTVSFVFTPAAMPAGDELFIGYLSPSQLAVTHGHPGSVERLVPAGGPLTCSTQPPPANDKQPPAPGGPARAAHARQG